MSEAEKRLSIIIITWNELANLERCLLSLVDKVDFSRDEVIVVDNGSRDGSEEFVATLPQVRYFPLETNLGVGPARNRGRRRKSGATKRRRACASPPRAARCKSIRARPKCRANGRRCPPLR